MLESNTDPESQQQPIRRRRRKTKVLVADCKYVSVYGNCSMPITHSGYTCPYQHEYRKTCNKYKASTPRKAYRSEGKYGGADLDGRILCVQGCFNEETLRATFKCPECGTVESTILSPEKAVLVKTTFAVSHKCARCEFNYAVSLMPERYFKIAKPELYSVIESKIDEEGYWMIPNYEWKPSWRWKQLWKGEKFYEYSKEDADAFAAASVKAANSTKVVSR